MLIRVITCLTLAVFVAGCERPAVEEGTGSGTIVEGSPASFDRELKRLRGKPVVVNYWATWCTPCREEMPRIVAAEKRYGRRVSFLGVDVQDDTDAAKAFVRSYDIPFKSLTMTRPQVQSSQKILGLPVTQFYGADGALAFVHQGEIEADELDDKINELLRIGRSASSPPPVD